MPERVHRYIICIQQEEFIFVLQGETTLFVGQLRQLLTPGMCAGFPAGGPAHHLVNNGTQEAVYLEFGDRVDGDKGIYPADDLVAQLSQPWCLAVQPQRRPTY